MKNKELQKNMRKDISKFKKTTAFQRNSQLTNSLNASQTGKTKFN